MDGWQTKTEVLAAAAAATVTKWNRATPEADADCGEASSRANPDTESAFTTEICYA